MIIDIIPRSLAVMAKFGKMMSVDDCDYIQQVKKFNLVGDKWYDWFIGNHMVANDTGNWYFGVVSLKDPEHPNLAKDNDGKGPNCQGMTKGDFNTNFGFQRYEMRIFTGGCYYFNEINEEWEGGGVTVNNLNSLFFVLSIY